MYFNLYCINKQKKNKIDDIFEGIEIPPAVKTAISLAVVAIPVVAGVCYLKDRKKIMNADTASAFMSMGNGTF